MNVETPFSRFDNAPIYFDNYFDKIRYEQCGASDFEINTNTIVDTCISVNVDKSIVKECNNKTNTDLLMLI